ncbi:hypothetical protein [Streptomyces sp. NPDC048565]|uniref:hypothetical protein n=1 Tax=Streptomyces sp. NPDC048565 TaxID=3155266 RepID=UPI00341B31D6
MELHQFAALSARLTGFDSGELQESGMVHAYRQVVTEQAGAERLDGLADSVGVSTDDPPRFTDESARELARAITHLWYLGTWPGVLRPPFPDGEAPPPASGPFVVSSRAYEQGLVWRAFGGRAPGTTAQGYGSWADSPSEVTPLGAHGGDSAVAK